MISAQLLWGVLLIKVHPGRGLQQLLRWRTCCKKYLRVTRVKFTHVFWSSVQQKYIEVTANFILDTLMRSIYIAHQTIQHLDTTCCGERTILPRIPETQIWYSRSHTIHKKEAVCLKSSNDTLENYIFCEYVKFVVISLKKLYFVNNCLINVRTKNPFPHLWHIWLQTYTAHQISFILNQFSVKCRFPFPILRGFFL